MHRDTKLGLALAILVMGFAAALCFPRSPGEQTESLTLQTAQELDTGILRQGHVKIHTDAGRPKPPVPDVVEVAQTTPVPVPTPAEATVTEVLPADSAPEPVANSTPSEPTPVRPANFPAEIVAEQEPQVVHHKKYTVKPNDTLSSIAKEQLGAAGKWGEIFAANRDKLSGPESLRPQMVLVIPIPEDDEIAPTAPSHAAIASTPDATSPEVSPAIQAAPVSNSPRNVPRARFSGQPSRIGSSNAPRLQ